MLALVRFALGAAAGSFLNVLILRYKPGSNLFGGQLLGRSRCPGCGEALRWFELIPIISFIFLRARCARCGAKISFQYPAVELICGLIAAFVPEYLVQFYTTAPTAWFSLLSVLWTIVFLTWLTIAIIDVRQYLVPDELNIILAVCGAALLVMHFSGPLQAFPASFLRHYAFMFFPSTSVLLSRVLGALLGGAFLSLFAFLSRGRAMGWGDVKLALAGGFILGFPDTAVSLFIAFIAGGIFGAVMLLLRRKTMKDRLPFAPFLVGGMAFTVLLGYQALAAYFGLLL